MNYSVSPKLTTPSNELQQSLNTKYITTTTHIVTILAACFKNTQEKERKKKLQGMITRLWKHYYKLL